MFEFNFSPKFLSFIFTALLLFATQLYAHCQIPCGVYDDTMRVKMIEEHTLTILKSMNYIASNQNDLEQQNQVTRWIINKEEHAQEIQKIVKEERKKLSDQKISDLLNKRGFNLARRTISKYRKKINLPSSRNR